MMLLYTRLAKSDTDDKAGTHRNLFSMYLLVWWDQSFTDNDLRYYMYGEEQFHKYLDMGMFAISSHIFFNNIANAMVHLKADLCVYLIKNMMFRAVF